MDEALEIGEGIVDVGADLVNTGGDVVSDIGTDIVDGAESFSADTSDVINTTPEAGEMTDVPPAANDPASAPSANPSESAPPSKNEPDDFEKFFKNLMKGKQSGKQGSMKVKANNGNAAEQQEKIERAKLEGVGEKKAAQEKDGVITKVLKGVVGTACGEIGRVVGMAVGGAIAGPGGAAVGGAIGSQLGKETGYDLVDVGLNGKKGMSTKETVTRMSRVIGGVVGEVVGPMVGIPPQISGSFGRKFGEKVGEQAFEQTGQVNEERNMFGDIEGFNVKGDQIDIMAFLSSDTGSKMFDDGEIDISDNLEVAPSLTPAPAAKVA